MRYLSVKDGAEFYFKRDVSPNKMLILSDTSFIFKLQDIELIFFVITHF